MNVTGPIKILYMLYYEIVNDISTVLYIILHGQRWASVSELKIWTHPLVLPARLCGAAAGNCAHRYIGKVCWLLLVRELTPPGAAQKAREIAQAVTRHRPISKLKLKVGSQTHGWGPTEMKGRSRRFRGENRAAKRAGMWVATVDVAATVKSRRWLAKTTRRVGS